jgi:hypothetical protein
MTAISHWFWHTIPALLPTLERSVGKWKRNEQRCRQIQHQKNFSSSGSAHCSLQYWFYVADFECFAMIAWSNFGLPGLYLMYGEIIGVYQQLPPLAVGFLSYRSNRIKVYVEPCFLLHYKAWPMRFMVERWQWQPMDPFSLVTIRIHGLLMVHTQEYI